jgi:hypothetical protein
MRILEDRIAQIILQLPTRRDDDFVVTVESFVAGDKVECGRRRVGWFANLDLNFAAQPVLAIMKRNEPVPEEIREFRIDCWSVSLNVHKEDWSFGVLAY